jgi:TldD protein
LARRAPSRGGRHGLEGDFNRKGTSAFSGGSENGSAHPGVTVVDDGSIADRRGSLSIDDEGTPTQENVLIEDGILKGYIQDRLNARLMGVAPTGNGRRESYAHAPMPRMTNTFMRGGEDDPQSCSAASRTASIAKSFGGGQVDIVSGSSSSPAPRPTRSRTASLGAPIKGATLIGDGPERAHPGHRDWQRPGARRRRRGLRQGRPERAAGVGHRRCWSKG